MAYMIWLYGSVDAEAAVCSGEGGAVHFFLHFLGVINLLCTFFAVTQDFNDIFCSYGGARMNSEIWSELLKEADRGGDGFISENEFADAMHMVMRNSIKMKKRDQRMRHTVKPPSDT